MSTGGIPLPSRAVVVSVACFSVVTATSLVNFAGSAFGYARGFLTVSFGLGTERDVFLIMAVAAGLAAVLGLIVIHQAPGSGWVWLLLGGTVLIAVQVVSYLESRPQPDMLGDVLSVAISTGPALVIMGLLGAGNWLIHAAQAGTGATVAGVGLAAPLFGSVVLYAAAGAHVSGDVIQTLNTTLAIVGVVGAIGVVAMLPGVRRLQSPPTPTRRVTALGAIAAILPMVPNIVLRIARKPIPVELTNPIDPFTATQDKWVVFVVLCGVLIFAAAIGLGALLGSKALGAALAAGLVLFGVELPLTGVPFDASTSNLILALLGLAVGGLAAMTRWRAWIAGAACALAGIVILVDRGGSDVLVPIAAVAAVTAAASAVSAVGERTQAPAVLGAVAVATQFGLVLTSMLARHSEFATDPGLPRIMTVLSGIALLVGALLVVSLRLIRITGDRDQAELSPGVAR